MTVADRQLIDWCRTRDYGSLKTSLAIGYLLMAANGMKPKKRLEDECKRTLEALRTQRMREELGR